MRKIMMTLGLASALALTACSVPATKASDSSPSASTAPSSSAPVETPESVETPEPAVEEATAKFGETWTYDDGISIVVTMGKLKQATQYAAGAEATKGVYRAFTVTITNGSKTIFDPSQTYAEVNYGANATSASRVFDTAGELGGGFEGRILPGKKQTVTMGFAMPANATSDIIMSISPSFKYEDVLYLSK